MGQVYVLNDVLKESYSYDLLGRLKTEQNVQSTSLVVYSYDNGGNITSKKKYVCQSTQIVTSESELTLQDQKTYNYDNVWKDKLINYNGQSITYDACGNPTNYKGITATWEKGRQLKSFGSNTYKYNASGIRISKTVGTVEHRYTLNGSNIICEEIKDQNITTKLDYLYDIDTSVCGMRVNNGEYYFFRKNLQGDIIAITDNVGNIIANYRYDAWGNHAVLNADGTICASGIGLLNPFRYRGYYYDTETQLYYLNSRYYDPEVCRFINSDEYVFILNQDDFDLNQFAYCGDNPINFTDNSGFLRFPSLLVSVPLDMIIMALAAHVAAPYSVAVAPVKVIAKRLGKEAFKKKFRSIAFKFIESLKKILLWVARKLISIIKKALGWIFRKWVKKLSAESLAATLLGVLISVTSNSFLNAIFKNITIILSIGGLVAGLWDFFSDKKLNGWITI